MSLFFKNKTKIPQTRGPFSTNIKSIILTFNITKSFIFRFHWYHMTYKVKYDGDGIKSI